MFPRLKVQENNGKIRLSRRERQASDRITSIPPARFPGFPVLVSTFTTSHFLVCFGASEWLMSHPKSKKTNITVETNSLDSTYSS